ncbi:MAG: hypothetical protein A3K66_04055 [Euryarchaeota archaeon RBG_16_67_27]|nr:MAG: hypothetical protein A3K66_04055 [Euryarchaeota archaeon RBG_16_67_27]
MARGDFVHRSGRSTARSVVVVVLIVSLFVGSGAASARAEDRPVRYNLYFGDLHTHTIYSDAWEGTPWDAFAAATAAGADFMATTDHDSYGFWLSPEEWADTLAAAEAFTTDTFVAMAGYELWIACAGEINVFNTPTFPPVPEDPDQRPAPGCAGSPFDVLPAFYDWLAAQPGAVGQWNHPTYVTNNFHDFVFRSDTRDAGVGMIEVWNWKYTEESYVLALDTGWHVMPTANSDTHSPDWMSSEVRTVLLAPRLTPEDLYAAMRAGRGYATLDKNLRISYALDGAVMGSILSALDSRFVASVQIEDPDGTPEDAITLVELVSDGGVVVASARVRGTAIRLTLEVTSETARYFYLRVSTASNHEGVPGVTAWTSPVWTGR